MGGETCPECSAPVSPKDRFCEACGRNLRVRRTPVGGPGSQWPPLCACGGAEFDEDGSCEACGRERPSARDRVEFALPGVAGISDRGRRRRRNEDSMAFGRVRGRGTAVVVCDGVASSERAEQASQVAVDTAADVLLTGLQSGTLQSARDAERATAEAVVAANAAVARLARPEAAEVAPSCTFVSAVVTDGSATVGWVGDSRAYLVAEAGAARLTSDDTWAAQLVAQGVLTEEEALTDRRAHVLSRWLGADSGVTGPQTVTFMVETPGLLVLCSDGLWNYVPEPEDLLAALPPEAIARRVAPLEVARALVQVALAAGGHDNITVVVVQLRGGGGS
ncbi:protein phosphatase 2C domain-containing protein [Saccharothrix yanglingensis]|uniref:Serine/threonine protein phosphatase n=1 Tax=Saccharothrix yanglingensis TaxID=659496 RepID=A0ABU0XDL5_9PSEU|nr:protein phosphatase 2C domain-containing protein [Saccharothrix yanglingensis]MDQ2588784.1 serine/threonine protein phosphatase [Saccharothrix yanglingensis]